MIARMDCLCLPSPGRAEIGPNEGSCRKGIKLEHLPMAWNPERRSEWTRSGLFLIGDGRCPNRLGHMRDALPWYGDPIPSKFHQPQNVNHLQHCWLLFDPKPRRAGRNAPMVREPCGCQVSI